MTCVPCKLLEHIVCSNIMAHPDEYKLLSDRQHAVRKRHSCETQLTTVINYWAKILDNRGQVDRFILDFEKAFDTPPHELLKSKLFSYGIGGKTLKIDRFFCLLQTTTNCCKVFGQTGLGKQCRPRSDCSLIRVYTVCSSLCIFWMHYSKEKPSLSTLRVITTHLLGVRIFKIFTCITLY